MENHSHSLSKSGGYNGNGFVAKTVYDDVFGGPPNFGVPTLSLRVEDYMEIFGTFQASRASSIPILDIPVVDEAVVSFDVRSSDFDYSEVFGGFKGLDFAVSFEELRRRGPKSRDDSSDEAWTPAQSEDLSEESGPSACSEKNQSSSNGEAHQSFDGTKQFNISYHQANQSSVPGCTFIASETLQMVEDENPPSQAINRPHRSSDSSGKMRDEKRLKKTISHSSKSTSGMNPDSLKGYDRSSSLPSKPFVTVSEISLRTQPSELPPPKRLPPVFVTKDGDSDKNSKLKASRSFSSDGKAGENSPPFFDVEVDASSSAAVSAAAMKDAMEKARAKLHSAKELKERKKEGLPSRGMLGLKSDIKDKEGKLGTLSDEFKSSKYERVQETYDRENSGTEVFEGHERPGIVKTTKVVSDATVEEENGNVAKLSAEKNQGKGYLASRESYRSEGNVAWKEAEEFYEVVETKSDEVFEHQVENNWKIKGGRQAHENKGISKVTEEPHKQEKHEKVKSAREVSGWEENEKTLPAAKQHGDVKKILPEDDKREGQKMLIEVQQNESKTEFKRKLKKANEKIDNNNLCRDAQEKEENKRRLDGTLEREENDKNHKEVMRQKEALEQEEKEKRQKEAREREEHERQKEAREREEHERRLRAALQQEESERRLKEALEREKAQKLLQLAPDQEEKERSQKIACERVGKEKKLEKYREQEESVHKPKESPVREENKRRLNEAGVRGEKEKGIKEASQQEKNRKRSQEAHEREECENGLKEALKLEETGRRPERASEWKETEKGNADSGKWEEMKGRSKCDEQNGLFVDERAIKSSQETHVSTEGEIFEVAKGKGKPDGNKNEATRVAYEDDNISGKLGGTEKGLSCEEEVIVRAEASDGLHLSDIVHDDSRHKNRIRTEDDAASLKDFVGKSGEAGVDGGQTRMEKNAKSSKMASELEKLNIVAHEQGERTAVKEVQVITKESKDQLIREWIETGKRTGTDQPDVLEQQRQKTAHQVVKTLNDTVRPEQREKEERMKREKELEKDRLRNEEREREREREKDRIAVERATCDARERASVEARERAERAAVERATAEVRQRAMADAREKLEKATLEARERSLAEKALMEARLKAERAAVDRATAEARERAVEKAMAEKAAFETRERIQRSVSDKFYASSRDGGVKPTSSSDLHFQNMRSSSESRYTYSSVHGGVEGESPQRCKARLERHQRTAERAAKALAEKNMRDLLAQREQTERNRLAEGLDAEIKRWSSGKEGNLRALLSTLQYILGPDSGWQPVPLTEVITSAAVKKAYRKATLCVHPDKLQQRGASIQQKHICEKVFDLLKEAWNRFNSEER